MAAHDPDDPMAVDAGNAEENKDLDEKCKASAKALMGPPPILSRGQSGSGDKQNRRNWQEDGRSKRRG